MTAKTAYDVVILGSGPAGLQAAIHAARRKVSVAVLGKPGKSSIFHAHVENFCCLFKVTGEDMLETGSQQARNFGAVFLEEDVLHIAPEDRRFYLKTESGARLEAKTLILATGTARNKLGVPGEKELLGRGVSYCVECDANFFRGQDVAVVGGESAAAGGVMTLLQYARGVHLICDRLQVAAALEAEIRQSAAVVHEGVRVKAIVGQSEVEALDLSDGSRLPVSGVFIEQGARGVYELATVLGIQLDPEMKYIQTTKQQETNLPGVYAAGDICGPPWQMAKAVGEGCVAGLAAATYAKKLT